MVYMIYMYVNRRLSSLSAIEYLGIIITIKDKSPRDQLLEREAKDSPTHYESPAPPEEVQIVHGL